MNKLMFRGMGVRALVVIGLLGAALAGPATVAADTVLHYQASYVEPVGGPNQSPFECPPGTTCGTASISGLGHAADQVAVFNACGFGCHERTVRFADGSTLVIQVVDEVPFGFTAPGNAGHHGYLGFPGPGGNPQQLNFTETIVGGTGRFESATGGGTGMVSLHGGVAIGHSSGTVTLP